MSEQSNPRYVVGIDPFTRGAAWGDCVGCGAMVTIRAEDYTRGKTAPILCEPCAAEVERTGSVPTGQIRG